MRSDDEDEVDHGRAGARARGFSEKAPKAPPYEDPADRQAREAESVDDRILAIALLMAQGRWSKVKALQYGNLWAVSPETVKGYAAQANRLRRHLSGSRGLKDAARITLDQLQAAYELAMSNGDAKGAVAAAKTMGEIRGAFPSKAVGKGQPEQPQAIRIPSQFSEFVEDERLLRFWSLTGRRPTPEQKARILAGASPEDVARSVEAS
jgi:hypothetical protein